MTEAEIEARNQHWERCVASARAHAEHLYASVRKGKLNGSAVYGLMEGFLDQPAYYPEWRAELLRLSVKGMALHDLSSRGPASQI